MPSASELERVEQEEREERSIDPQEPLEIIYRRGLLEARIQLDPFLVTRVNDPATLLARAAGQFIDLMEKHLG
jgi:hypothetical protein